MNLPKIYPITSDAHCFKDLQILVSRLTPGKNTIFQYRRKNLSQSEVKRELASLKVITSKMNISFTINSFHGKKLANEFSGFHLTGEDLEKASTREIDKTKLFGISCHNEEDILKAESIEADYIFISPIKETSTKKKIQPLGWKRFSELSKKTRLPVYALGGLSTEDLSEAEKYGGYGVAGISRFWSH